MHKENVLRQLSANQDRRLAVMPPPLRAQGLFAKLLSQFSLRRDFSLEEWRRIEFPNEHVETRSQEVINHYHWRI